MADENFSGDRGTVRTPVAIAVGDAILIDAASEIRVEIGSRNGRLALFITRAAGTAIRRVRAAKPAASSRSKRRKG